MDRLDMADELPSVSAATDASDLAGRPYGTFVSDEAPVAHSYGTVESPPAGVSEEREQERQQRADVFGDVNSVDDRVTAAAFCRGGGRSRDRAHRTSQCYGAMLLGGVAMLGLTALSAAGVGVSSTRTATGGGVDYSDSASSHATVTTGDEARAFEAGASGSLQTPPAMASLNALTEENTRNMHHTGKAGDETLPHIIFFIVDDQGWNDIGYQSSDLDWATPFIDHMANTGVKLERYYTMHLCTPARASLLTGRYAVNTGMQHDVIQSDAPWGLPIEFKIFPQYLNELGYSSHAVGKWHIGFFNETYLPTSRGFESYVGYLGDQEHYKTHRYTKSFGDVATNDNNASETNYDNMIYFYDFIETRPDNSFELLGKAEGFANVSSADIFVRQSSKLLHEHAEDQGERPLFMYLAWQNVHGPLDMLDDYYWEESGDVDKEIVAKVRSIPQDTRRHFASLLVQLDNSIEKVVHKVNETIGTERTLFLYASDNGGCKEAGGYNTPLRGGKHYMFEGGVRVPAFMSSARFPTSVAGTIYPGLFHVTDWLATVMGFIAEETTALTQDIMPGNTDSISHWSDIKKGDTKWGGGPRTSMILNIDKWITGSEFELLPINFTRGAMVLGDLKLILNEYDNRWYRPLAPAEVRSSNYSYWGYGLHQNGTLRFDGVDNGTISSKGRLGDCGQVHGVNYTSYLFNITADPAETVNLIHDFPQIASEMQYIMESYEVHPPAYERVMETKASGVFQKNFRHFVPWCEENCGKKNGVKGGVTWTQNKGR